MGSHRANILYLLFFLIFFFIGEGEACEGQGESPKLARGHACCSAPADEGTPPAGKTLMWSDTWQCRGNFCGCYSGEPRIVAADRRLVNDQPLLRLPPEVLYYVVSFTPLAATVSHQPPLIPFPPLYLRNCAFLI